MAKNLGTIVSFTESLESDYFIARQNGKDVRVSRQTLYGDAFPVGTVLPLTTLISPVDLGYKGIWKLWVGGEGRLETATADSSSLGKFEGDIIKSFPLPEHTHTATIEEAGAHTHSLYTTKAEVNSRIYDSDDTTSPYGVSISLIGTTSAGAHTHSAVTGYGGTGNISLSLQPRGMKINLWERIS